MTPTRFARACDLWTKTPPRDTPPETSAFLIDWAIRTPSRNTSSHTGSPINLPYLTRTLRPTTTRGAVELHVALHPVYRAPVLLWRSESDEESVRGLFQQDGSPVEPLVELHPILNERFFALHPCTSGDWLALLQRGGSQSPGSSSSPSAELFVWWVMVSQMLEGCAVSPTEFVRLKAYFDRQAEDPAVEAENLE